MKLTAYSILLFFICLNLSLYLINQSGVLPSYETIQPYTEPTDIASKFAYVDLSTGNLMIGIVAFSAIALFGLLTGHLILGGTVALVLLSVDLLSPIAGWVIFGFPKLLAQIGVHPLITTVVTILFAYPWYWFMFSFIAQRQVLVQGEY